jgi:hypothetical protein
LGCNVTQFKTIAFALNESPYIKSMATLKTELANIHNQTTYSQEQQILSLKEISLDWLHNWDIYILPEAGSSQGECLGLMSYCLQQASKLNSAYYLLPARGSTVWANYHNFIFISKMPLSKFDSSNSIKEKISKATVWDPSRKLFRRDHQASYTLRNLNSMADLGGNYLIKLRHTHGMPVYAKKNKIYYLEYHTIPHQWDLSKTKASNFVRYYYLKFKDKKRHYHYLDDLKPYPRLEKINNHLANLPIHSPYAPFTD